MIPVLRVARPTTNLARTSAMYQEGLGFEVLAEFYDHEGFDGKILGYPGSGYHLELTVCRQHPVVPTPTPEDLLVLYIDETETFVERADAMIKAGFREVSSLNPYWDVRGKTFVDPDGYRTVLQNASWT